VAGYAGIPFEPGALVATLRRVLDMPEFDRERLRQAAMARVREHYSWDAVTDAYEGLLKAMMK
jgi:glycosyltransferase involved in cell wall biosynthesis